MADKENGKLTIGPVVLNYVAVWEPKAMEGSDKEKYSVQIRLHKKKDIATINEINKTAKRIALANKDSMFKGKTAGLKMPLNDGDTKDDESLHGHYYFNASSDTKPGVVDSKLKPIIDEDEIYSGVIAYITVNLFPFNKKNKGVAIGLNNIMKVKDGERIAGKPSAQSDFKDLVIESGDDDDFLDDEDIDGSDLL